MKSNLIFNTIYGCMAFFCNSHSMYLHSEISRYKDFIGRGGVRHSLAGFIDNSLTVGYC